MDWKGQNPIEIVHEGANWKTGKVLFMCDYCGTTFIADETQYRVTIEDGEYGYFAVCREVHCPVCRAVAHTESKHRYAGYPSKEVSDRLKEETEKIQGEKSISIWRRIKNFFGR